METENDTGKTEVTEYTSDPDEIVSGTLSINTPIPNATVQIVENSSVIEMTGTNAESNMSSLDFTNTWKTTDSYPKSSRIIFMLS